MTTEWCRQTIRYLAFCTLLGSMAGCGSDAVTDPGPPPPEEKDFIVMAKMTAGAYHACAVSGAGSGVPEGTVYCWGRNDVGQLGTGTATAGDVRTVPTIVTGDVEFVRLAAGLEYSCGISDAFQLWCWGAGPGQGSSQPTLLESERTFALLAGGDDHACAISTNDELLCWGGNDFGQLGDGTQTRRDQPHLLAGITARAVAAGAGHTCVIDDTGATLCWGRNDAGQLGTGSAGGPELTPTPMDPGSPALVDVTAGQDHTCGITSSNEAYCWGSNARGQLGTTQVTGLTATPVAVEGGITFRTLAAGAIHTCGVDDDDIGYCWGDNGSNQLGFHFTDLPMLSVPDSVHFELPFQFISPGRNHTCATARDLGYCWGDNAFGQLGDGSTSPRLVPGRVLGTP